jgi:hypothetical protein
VGGWKAGGVAPRLPAGNTEESGGGQMTIHFVVHDEGDSVGVVVVEGLKSASA